MAIHRIFEIIVGIILLCVITYPLVYSLISEYQAKKKGIPYIHVIK